MKVSNAKLGREETFKNRTRNESLYEGGNVNGVNLLIISPSKINGAWENIRESTKRVEISMNGRSISHGLMNVQNL
jgi:hypothetical protein